MNSPKTIANELDKVLEVLELDSTFITFLDKDIQLIPHELWRQDDNGHKFLIETFPCKADAIKALKDFEKLHHRQTYWTQKI